MNAGANDAPAPTRSSERIFLIAMDAERGAETLFLLRLLRWMREAGVQMEVLLWRRGPLLEEMRELCTVRVVDDLSDWWVDRFLRAVGLGVVGKRIKGQRMRWWMRRAAHQFPHALVLGVPAARALRYATKPLPAVLLLPAEERPWDERVTPEEWATILGRCAGFIVPDDSARSWLVAGQGVDAERVRVQRGFLPAIPAPGESEVKGVEELGLPEDALVVCGTGTDAWWRAPEPFVPVAWELCRRLPDANLHFVWLCHDMDEDALWPLRHDIANAGLQDRFHIVPATVLMDQFEASDLVLLTGRPDTFRLISAELRLSARPVVCFANGLTEVELGDAAVSVPYLDIEAAADAAAHLLSDPDAARELMARAVEQAGRTHELATDLPRWLLDSTAELLA